MNICITAKSTATFFLALLLVLPGASLANQPPKIVNPGVFHHFDGQPPATLAVRVSDLETPVGNLTLRAMPSHPELLAPDSIEITGAGSERTLLARPYEMSRGLVRVDLTVQDLGGAEGYSYATLVVNETKMPLKNPLAGDRAGSAIAVGRDFLAVGSPESDLFGNRTGSVSIFIPGHDGWKFSQLLSPAKRVTGRRFGVSISTDGETLAIGADGAGAWGGSTGSVHIFRRSGARWLEAAVVTPSDPQTGDLFGQSVAIRGTYLVAGAPGRDDLGQNSGGAYAFSMDSSGIWRQEARLVPSSPKSGMAFGTAVSIWGETAVAGAPGSGSAGIFERRGGAWVEVGTVHPDDAFAPGGFGASLSLRGNLLAVGAPSRRGTGTISLFGLDSEGWTLFSELTPSDGARGDLFGTSVALSDSHLAAGSPGNPEKGEAAGSAYVYTFGSGEALETFKVTSSDCVRGDLFGSAVAIFGADLAVGAPRHDSPSADTGGCYGYKLPVSELPTAPAEVVEAGPSDLYGKGKTYMYQVVSDFDLMKSRFSGTTWFTLSFWAKARYSSAGTGNSKRGIPVAAFRICAGDLGPNGDGILRYWADQRAEVAVIEGSPAITPATGSKGRNLAARTGIFDDGNTDDTSGWARYFVTFPIDWADPGITFEGCRDIKGFKPSVTQRSNWKGIIYVYNGAAAGRTSEDPKGTAVLFDAIQLEAFSKLPSGPSVYADRQNIDAVPIK